MELGVNWDQFNDPETIEYLILAMMSFKCYLLRYSIVLNMILGSQGCRHHIFRHLQSRHINNVSMILGYFNVKSNAYM